VQAQQVPACGNHQVRCRSRQGGACMPKQHWTLADGRMPLACVLRARLPQVQDPPFVLTSVALDVSGLHVSSELVAHCWGAQQAPTQPVQVDAQVVLDGQAAGTCAVRVASRAPGSCRCGCSAAAAWPCQLLRLVAAAAAAAPAAQHTTHRTAGSGRHTQGTGTMTLIPDTDKLGVTRYCLSGGAAIGLRRYTGCMARLSCCPATKAFTLSVLTGPPPSPPLLPGAGGGVGLHAPDGGAAPGAWAHANAAAGSGLDTAAAAAAAAADGGLELLEEAAAAAAAVGPGRLLRYSWEEEPVAFDDDDYGFDGGARYGAGGGAWQDESAAAHDAAHGLHVELPASSASPHAVPRRERRYQHADDASGGGGAAHHRPRAPSPARGQRDSRRHDRVAGGSGGASMRAHETRSGIRSPRQQRGRRCASGSRSRSRSGGRRRRDSSSDRSHSLPSPPARPTSPGWRGRGRGRRRGSGRGWGWGRGGCGRGRGASEYPPGMGPCVPWPTRVIDSPSPRGHRAWCVASQTCPQCCRWRCRHARSAPPPHHTHVHTPCHA
jgi:hypothetical protein